MPSKPIHHPIKLLDLPLLILAHIVALVSNGKSCKYPSLPFQVNCEPENWEILDEPRAVCRKFRQACGLAIGGLKYSAAEGVGLDDEGDPCLLLAILYEDMMIPPISSLRTLPHLNQLVLDRMCSGTIGTVLQAVPGLKCIIIRPGCHPDKLGSLKQFPSSTCLEEFVLLTLQAEQVNHLLSFPFDNLSFLELVGTQGRPVIPKNVLRKLTDFLWDGSSLVISVQSLFVNLKRAPSLQYLRLIDCYLDDAEVPWARGALPALKTIVVSSTSPLDTSRDIELAMTRDRLPALRELDFRASTSRSWSFTDIRPMLGSCASSLKILRLKLNISLTQAVISLLNRMNVADDFALHLTLEHLQQDARYSLRVLLPLNHLTSITVMHNIVKHIDELVKAPKLRSAQFYCCKLKHGEVRKLITKPGKLEEIVFHNAFLHKSGPRYNFSWKSPALTK